MGAFDEAASAAIPNTGTVTPSPLQTQLMTLLHAQQQGGGGGKPLVSFGPAIPQASAPPVFQTHEPVVANRPGGYRTTGERKRDEKAALFHNIASLTQDFAKYENDKKQRHMQTLTERLMTAVQGYDAAKQSGNEDAIKQNATIINDILGDPKNRKLFEKAFDINFFGDSKGKGTPEQKGLFAAMAKMNQDFHGGKTPLNAYAQRFMQMNPQVPQLSPEAQAQAQAVKEGLLPTADAQIKSGAALAIQDLKSLDAGNRDKAIVDAAKLRADATDKHSQAMLDAQFMRGIQQLNHDERMAAITHYKANVTAGLQAKRLALTEQMFQQTMGLKNKIADSNIQFKGFNELKAQADQLEKKLANVKAMKTNIDNQLAKIDSKGWLTKLENADQLADWQNQQINLGTAISNITTDIQALQKKMQAATQMNAIIQQNNSVAGSSGLFDSEDDSNLLDDNDNN